MGSPAVVRSGVELAALVAAFAERIADLLAGRSELAVVGVRRGGIALASRVTERLRARGIRVDAGTVDVALYRDDVHLSWPRAEAGATDILFPIDGRDVVLVDDVFWTGRTARAAMDAVLDFGRPRRLWLAALVLRAGRELPISPDVYALEFAAQPDERIELRLTEDGHPTDELVLVRTGDR